MVRMLSSPAGLASHSSTTPRTSAAFSGVCAGRAEANRRTQSALTPTKYHFRDEAAVAGDTVARLLPLHAVSDDHVEREVLNCPVQRGRGRRKRSSQLLRLLAELFQTALLLVQLLCVA